MSILFSKYERLSYMSYSNNIKMLTVTRFASAKVAYFKYILQNQNFKKDVANNLQTSKYVYKANKQKYTEGFFIRVKQ